MPWTPEVNRDRMDIRASTQEMRLPLPGSLDDYMSTARDRALVHPQTPPDSTSGSPRPKIEGPPYTFSRDCSPMPKAYQMKPFGENQLRLPSLEEFDQGVEALARSYGPPQAAGSSMRPMEGLMQGLAPSRPLPEARFGSLDSFSLHQQSAPMVHPSHSMDGYPSPPPESEGRHINQKYTTEEGDFIIYAWHDKRMRWHTIKDHFAAMFGRTPERTVQGLQAWYYRMNQKIPVWDQDGWLCFENEDDLEPKYVSIKCRDRDSREKPSAPLGLAQRYPERAIAYPWVDPEIRGKAQDWAAKREMQYHQRRERRRMKEQRRLKL